MPFFKTLLGMFSGDKYLQHASIKSGPIKIPGPCVLVFEPCNHPFCELRKALMPAPVYVFGPTTDVTEVEIPPPVTPTPSRITIGFQDPPTLPGGVVQLNIPLAQNIANVYPEAVHVFYAPVDKIPTDGTANEAWFVANSAGFPSIRFDMTPMKGILSNTPHTDFTVNVSGVVPSTTPYRVTTVLEYAS